MDLSVVVPVRNEAENVAAVAAEIRAALAGRFAFEIIFADDGSSDATPAELRKLKARMPEVRVVTLDRPSGKSRAIIEAVRRAAAPVVCTMDGDGQDDPRFIGAFWERMNAPGDKRDNRIVCAHRQNRRDSWIKRRVSPIANAVRRMVLKDNTPDSGCGYKMFARDAFLELPRFENMHRFLPALFIRRGGEAVSVPVVHRPRAKGRSKYGVFDRLWVGIWDLLGVAWLARRTTHPGVKEEK
jgi:dolichol-phosphate mannosyltransferase